MPSKKVISLIKNNFESYPENVFIKDKNSIYHYLNPAIMKNLEISDIDFFNKTDYEKYPSCADSYVDHDQMTMKGNIYYQLDVISLFSEFDRFNLCIKTPLKETNGSICGVLGFSHVLNYEELIFTLKKKNNLTHLKLSDDCKNLINQSISLTKKELHILYYFLQGKSAKRIAQSLEISEVTVNFHLKNIKEKWKCFSKEGVFSQAFNKGLIGFSGWWDLINFNI